jgi:hypothetical protein
MAHALESMGAVSRGGVSEEVEGAGAPFIPPPGPTAKGEGPCAVEAPVVGVDNSLQEGGCDVVGVRVDDRRGDDLGKTAFPDVFHGVVDDPTWGGVTGRRWNV